MKTPNINIRFHSLGTPLKILILVFPQLLLFNTGYAQDQSLAEQSRLKIEKEIASKNRIDKILRDFPPSHAFDVKIFNPKLSSKLNDA